MGIIIRAMTCHTATTILGTRIGWAGSRYRQEYSDYSGDYFSQASSADIDKRSPVMQTGKILPRKLYLKYASTMG